MKATQTSQKTLVDRHRIQETVKSNTTDRLRKFEQRKLIALHKLILKCQASPGASNTGSKTEFYRSYHNEIDDISSDEFEIMKQIGLDIMEHI